MDKKEIEKISSLIPQVNLILPELIKQFQSFFPDSKTFVKYCEPYFFRIEDDYNRMQNILTKIGVTDGIKGTWGLLCDIIKEEIAKEDFVCDLISKLQTLLPDAEAAITTGGGIQGAIKVFIGDTLIPGMANKIYVSIPEQKLKHIQELENRTKALPAEEQEFCEEFNLLGRKLLLSYAISNISETTDKLLKILLKNYLLEYYKKENELYGKKVVPEKIIKHLEDIYIVGEDKILALSTVEADTDSKKDVYYYWKYSVECLKKFEELLVKYEYIEYQEGFEVLFKTYAYNQVKKPIIFKGTKPELWYMFYKINKNDTFYEGKPLHYITSSLFEFADKKNTKNVINSGWGKFIEKMQSTRIKEYIQKRLNKADRLISELNLPQ